MARSRFKYSVAVYAYVPKAMKRTLLKLQQQDPENLSQSKIIEDALADYIPKLKGEMRYFKSPIHDAPGRRKRRAA